jgi:hypothetical protein
VVNELSHSLYPKVWNTGKCEIKTISSAEQKVATPCNATVGTNISEQYTAFIFSAEIRGLWMQSGYTGTLQRKWSVQSDRSGREYLSLCGPMEMGK